MQKETQLKQGIVIEQSIVVGQVIDRRQPNGPNFMTDIKANNGLTNESFDQMLVYEAQIFTQVINIWNRNTGVLTLKTFLEMYQVRNIQKVKVYRQAEPRHPNSYMLKVTVNQKDHLFAAKYNDQGEWFYRIIWAKLVGMKISCDVEEEFINVCCGDILKKSEILGKWEERYVMITPKDGLMSYRDRKANPTMVIQEAKELWTRFQFMHGGAFLVIKIKNKVLKEEFAIPVNHAIQWLRAFYSLLKIYSA